ncbi:MULTISPECIES: helix-turn-helix domain-containing protein [unclassified Enterococcus]|uniref:HTH araC/xylS-type domain-containing protein n=1 Tax=Candidatus Enterococcus dunnyi TaxID=1834192 RepID=A0A200JF67_9ENTE|nr:MULTISPECIES: helix-turn-helix domain-containing protein [unclassified Enterococcus]OUZ35237.1 hypothetical protein A5889_000713 [Enterococcus sp. 9D6_DIV0238]
MIKSMMPDIIDFIKTEALAKKMTSEEIANHFGYDKYHFSRKFKEINGFSIAEYISSLKIEKAVTAIDQPKKMIELQDISEFESSSSFTNTFKKFTGSAPKKYKNEMTELFSEVKSFESSNEYHAVEYYEKQDASYCNVTVEVPENFDKGLFFIGLFRTPIPNHRPISGIATKRTKLNVLKNVPNGEYYLLVCAIDRSTNIFSYFNLQNCLRGRVMEKLSFPECSGERYTVKLRPPIPEDPPILLSVAKLLISSLKNTI